jgi:hypothetical protein
VIDERARIFAVDGLAELLLDHGGVGDRLR